MNETALKVYLAGKMTGLSLNDMQKWRMRFTQYIDEYASNCDIDDCVHVFNPCDYYNPLLVHGDSDTIDREAMKFDLYHLKDSDIMVANLNGVSIGTAMEVAIANENGIPVIGFCDDKKNLHPWLKEDCVIVLESVEDVAMYMCDYFIYPMMV